MRSGCRQSQPSPGHPARIRITGSKRLHAFFHNSTTGKPGRLFRRIRAVLERLYAGYSLLSCPFPNSPGALLEPFATDREVCEESNDKRPAAGDYFSLRGSNHETPEPWSARIHAGN